MAVFKWQKRTSPHFGEVWVPFAEVQFQDAQSNFRKIFLKIDTGAVVSLLRRSFAELLGVDLESGRKIDLTNVAGGKTVCYLHEFQIRFEEVPPFSAPFAFAESDAVPNLLGRLGIMDVGQIDFDSTLEETRFTGRRLDPEARRIWDFFIDTQKHIYDRWADLEIPFPGDQAARLLLTRGDQLFAGLAGIVKLGRTWEAPLYWRALQEHSLQLEYLLHDPAQRGQLYLEFAHVTRRLHEQAMLKNHGPGSQRLASSPTRVEGEERNLHEFNRVKHLFEWTDNKDKLRLHKNWYCLHGTRELARAVDRERELNGAREGEYVVWYARWSQWNHGNPFAAGGFNEFQKMPPSTYLSIGMAFLARMLLHVSDNILLTSDQYEGLKVLAQRLD